MRKAPPNAPSSQAGDSKVLPPAVRRPPNAGKGRKKGVPNKSTAALKDAILVAAAQSGGDQNGKGGLVGYLKRVADEDVKAFSGLLGKVLPLQVTGGNGERLIPESLVFLLTKVPGADCRP